jgi:hypothetical protein
MIWLYRHFASEPHLTRAIAIWVEAEQEIAALERNVERLRQRILSQSLFSSIGDFENSSLTMSYGEAGGVVCRQADGLIYGIG